MNHAWLKRMLQQRIDDKRLIKLIQQWMTAPVIETTGCRGKPKLIRYADDFIVAFQLRNDAENFYTVLPKRLKKLGLDIAPEKTRLMRFSRYSLGRKRSFTFLGFKFY